LAGLIESVFHRARRSVTVRRYRFLDRSQQSLSMAASAALDEAPQAVGLDIFDTIVVRRLAGDAACERVVANLLAEGDGWPHQAQDFADEIDDVRRTSGSLALVDWLDILDERHGLDAGRAYQTFLEVERELNLAIPGAQEALDALRAEAPITFVSDMHFSAQTLRSLLEPLELVAVSDTIIASCDTGVSKADGGLFALDQLRELGLDDAPFIGNNLWSDATQARIASLRPRPATVGNLTRLELTMAAHPDSLGPAIAGAARIQRLEANQEAASSAEVSAVGGQVMGQAILAFLLWVRRKCLDRGITNLVFLARDGELPLQLARAMPEDHWDGVELRYLHCGRRSWSLPAAPIVGVHKWIEVGTADDAAFLLQLSNAAPFADLLDRCGLTIDQVDPTHPLASTDPTSPLTTTQALEWRDLLRSGDLDAPILAAAEEPRRRIVDHLKQSGFPKAKTALIDVGWRGQQAWLISALIGEATGQEPLHLHFGGDRVAPHLEDQVDIERFAFDDSREPHPISSPVACLEMFLASGKPRLKGYERDADGIVHEVFERHSTSVDNPTRRMAAAGAVEVAALFPTRAEIDSWKLEESSLIPETRNLLAEFWNTPTTREAELLSGLRFEADDGGALVGPVVNPYAMSEILGRSMHPRMWREASLRTTPFVFRRLMKLYFAARSAGSR